MNNNIINTDTCSGTIGGTLVVLLLQATNELYLTLANAAAGALVSFIVSIICSFLWKKIKEASDVV